MSSPSKGIQRPSDSISMTTLYSCVEEHMSQWTTVNRGRWKHIPLQASANNSPQGRWWCRLQGGRSLRHGGVLHLPPSGLQPPWTPSGTEPRPTPCCPSSHAWQESTQQYLFDQAKRKTFTQKKKKPLPALENIDNYHSDPGVAFCTAELKKASLKKSREPLKTTLALFLAWRPAISKVFLPTACGYWWDGELLGISLLWRTLDQDTAAVHNNQYRPAVLNKWIGGGLQNTHLRAISLAFVGGSITAKHSCLFFFTLSQSTFLILATIKFS